jgi:peptide/nickel transport system substrate-binding protein
VVEFKAGPGGILRLARFDGYWAKDRPYLDELIIKHYPDEATLSLALEKGEVQLAGFGSLDSTNRLKKNSNLKVSDADNELGAQVFIVFNTQSKVFARKEARQAVAYGIDKKQLIDILLPGIKEETGPIPAGTRFYAKDGVNTYPFDAAKSAAALRQSGNGLGMDFTLDYIPGADELIKAPAEVIKAQLAKVGINVTLRASPDTAAWATRVAAGNFEATITSLFMWGDPVIGTNRMFLTDNIRPVIFANNAAWARASVDDLMTKAGGELDATKRKAMYVEFQKQIMDEAPHYYLWEAPIKVVTNKSVQTPPEGAWTLLSPMDQVWLK